MERIEMKGKQNIQGRGSLQLQFLIDDDELVVVDDMHPSTSKHIIFSSISDGG